LPRRGFCKFYDLWIKISIENLVLSFESRPDRRIYQFSLLIVLYQLWFFDNGDGPV